MSRGTIIRDDTNTPRTITGVQVRDGTNTPRDISEIRVRDSNNVSRVVFTTALPFSASASPSTVSQFANMATLTAGPTTVTPVGGTAPYTHAWTLVSFDGPATPTATAPTSATTSFTQGSIAFGESYSAEWDDAVTDSSVPPQVAHATVFSFWARS